MNGKQSAAYWAPTASSPPGSPLADGRTINICKPSQPDDEQKRVYQMLGIDWKCAFPTKKTEIPA